MRGVRISIRHVRTVVLWMTAIVAFVSALGWAAPRTARAGCGDYLLHDRQSLVQDLVPASHGADADSERRVPHAPVKSRCGGRECAPAPLPTTRSTPLRIVERYEALAAFETATPAGPERYRAATSDVPSTLVELGRIFRPPRKS